MSPSSSSNRSIVRLFGGSLNGKTRPKLETSSIDDYFTFLRRERIEIDPSVSRSHSVCVCVYTLPSDDGGLGRPPRPPLRKKEGIYKCYYAFIDHIAGPATSGEKLLFLQGRTKMWEKSGENVRFYHYNLLQGL